ncbi:MATE family efflux transporter, partial [bacterium]|nr:MATE family efflux transporter [bacterium]
MAIKELTSGNPLKLILLFAFPIFLGNIFQQFYNLVDTLITGRFIGVNALAAVGATGSLIFLLISFIFASTQGFSIVLAQRFGAKDYVMMRKSLACSLILSFILTIVLTLISTPFTKTLLEFLNTPNDILKDSTDYLFIMFAGIFATVYYNISSNTLRAVGDSKTPLVFLIFASILNIILDILFIVQFKMGVIGVGIATVLSQGISTVFCMSWMFLKFPILRLKKDDWKINKDFVLEHIRIGIP